MCIERHFFGQLSMLDQLIELRSATWGRGGCLNTEHTHLQSKLKIKLEWETFSYQWVFRRFVEFAVT